VGISQGHKPGAATIIGHQALKAAVPDGYTIGYSSTNSQRVFNGRLVRIQVRSPWPRQL
jgi:hypothetical protein